MKIASSQVALLKARELADELAADLDAAAETETAGVAGAGAGGADASARAASKTTADAAADVVSDSEAASKRLSGVTAKERAAAARASVEENQRRIEDSKAATATPLPQAFANRKGSDKQYAIASLIGSVAGGFGGFLKAPEAAEIAHHSYAAFMNNLIGIDPTLLYVMTGAVVGAIAVCAVVLAAKGLADCLNSLSSSSTDAPRRSAATAS